MSGQASGGPGGGAPCRSAPTVTLEHDQHPHTFSSTQPPTAPARQTDLSDLKPGRKSALLTATWPLWLQTISSEAGRVLQTLLTKIVVGSVLGASPAQAQEPIPAEAEPPTELSEESATLIAARAAAQAAEERGDPTAALASWQLVRAALPADVEAAFGVGRAHAARGERAAALRALRTIPHDAEQAPAAWALAAQLELDDDPRAATVLFSQVLEQAPADPDAHLGRARAQLRARARPAPDALIADVNAFLCCATEAALAAATPHFVEMSDQLREQGLDDTAAELLRLAVERGVGGEQAELQGRLDRLLVERAARTLTLAAARPLSPTGRAALERARAAAAAGELRAAREQLDAVVAAEPRSAEVRGADGDLLLLQGDVAGAEQAWRWAVALAPEQPEWRARLGVLLAERYAGRRHPEAVEQLRLATRLRPGQAALHLRLAEVLLEMGSFDEAEAELEAALATSPEATVAAAATRRLDDLRRRPPPPSEPPPASPEEAGAPAAAARSAQITRVYLDRGELERARAELLVVQKLAPDWVGVHELEAAIALRSGDLPAAERSFRAGLRADPAQPQLALALADLLLLRGATAEAEGWLRAAASAGAVDARWQLARLASDRGDLFEAKRELDAYFALAPQGLSLEPAQSLRRQLDRRLARLAAASGGGLLLVAVGAGGWWRARRRRADLRRMVARAPELAPELARTLTAIRHEVLKHNTNLLSDVAHALEHGDGHAAAFAAQRLFGAPGGDGGVVSRFRGDIHHIDVLARRIGLRFHPPSDPVLGPLIDRINALAALEGPMRHPRDRPALAARLRALSTALNTDSYRALGHLIRRLGTLTLTEALIRAVDGRVRAEPQLAGLDLPPLLLDHAGRSAPGARAEG
jgi:predicted Zn-dependent protease